LTLSAGRLTLSEEKKCVADISTLQRAKRTIDTIDQKTGTPESTDDLRVAVKELEKQRDAFTAPLKAISDSIEAIKSVRQSSSGDVKESRKKQNEARDIVKAENTKWDELRVSFKLENDLFYTAIKGEKERKQEEWKAQKLEEANVKINLKAQEELDNADSPAFINEITTCKALLNYFTQTYNLTLKASEVVVKDIEPKFNIRQVDSDFQNFSPMKKSGDGDYFMGVGKKDQKVKVATPAKQKAIRLDLDIMDQLSALKISIPTSVEDVQITVNQLQIKIDYFKTNQQSQTISNKKKAEDKVAALRKAAAESFEVKMV